MEVEFTFNDPKAYTRPWSVTVPFVLLSDTDIIDNISENEKAGEHIFFGGVKPKWIHVGRAPDAGGNKPASKSRVLARSYPVLNRFWLVHHWCKSCSCSTHVVWMARCRASRLRKIPDRRTTFSSNSGC